MKKSRMLKMALLSMAIFMVQSAVSKDMVSMKAHTQAKVGCNQCHKTETSNPYVANTCIECHEETGEDRYYRGELDDNGQVVKKDYKESGRIRMTSIHDSHGGEIRCTVCHTAHKEPPQLYCNNCHQFEVRQK